MSKKYRKGPERGRPVTFTWLEALGFLAGVLAVLFAAALLSAVVHSLTWRLNLKYNYVEGQARVEKTEIIHRRNVYELEITYHLEKDGVSYRRVSSLEPENRSVPTLPEIEVRRGQYRIGELHRCWFRPEDPGNTTALLPEGLEIYFPLSRLWLPFAFGIPAYFLCRWLWYRRAARESRARPAKGGPLPTRVRRTA